MSLIAIDTETGGLDPLTDALLSVSLIDVDQDLNPQRSLDIFILPEPGKSIRLGAARVNGYTEKLWRERGAVSLAEAYKTMAAWIPPKSEALAHNAPFDKGFITEGEKLTGINLGLHYRWRCSYTSFVAVNDALGLAHDCSLDTLARVSGHWGADFKRGDHKASDDALACAVGYRWLLQQIRKGAAA